jgi:sec-independent protein translocase protein TatB
MFDLSFGKLLILALAALFILGPERLPEAAAWLGRTIRQMREFATGAREQLNREIGPEFDQLRQPLDELRSFVVRGQSLGAGLREFDPKRAAIRAVFDDNPPTLLGRPRATPTGATSPGSTVPPPPSSTLPPARPLLAGERPPIDPDAT